MKFIKKIIKSIFKRKFTVGTGTYTVPNDKDFFIVDMSVGGGGSKK